MPKVPYPYEVNGKLVTGSGSLIPICSLSNRSLLPILTVLDFWKKTDLFSEGIRNFVFKTQFQFLLEFLKKILIRKKGLYSKITILPYFIISVGQKRFWNWFSGQLRLFWNFWNANFKKVQRRFLLLLLGLIDYNQKTPLPIIPIASYLLTLPINRGVANYWVDEILV